MKIIHTPHPTLRQTAQKVMIVDKKLLQFLEEFTQTLKQKKNPRGVGLAAPQVDKKWQIFLTQLPSDPQDPDSTQIQVFINPEITDRSSTLTFGPDPEEPILEGCLSIPDIYGPVPRFSWVDLAFQKIENGELVPDRVHVDAFPARVIQHEFDHLFGKLFLDYTREYDLPLYKGKDTTEKLLELDQEMIEAIIVQSQG